MEKYYDDPDGTDYGTFSGDQCPVTAAVCNMLLKSDSEEEISDVNRETSED